VHQAKEINWRKAKKMYFGEGWHVEGEGKELRLFQSLFCERRPLLASRYWQMQAQVARGGQGEKPRKREYGTKGSPADCNIAHLPE
jgi:hypothetical protein